MDKQDGRIIIHLSAIVEEFFWMVCSRQRHLLVLHSSLCSWHLSSLILSVSLQNPHGNSAHHIVKCYSRRSRAYTWQYSLNMFSFSSRQNKQIFCVSFLAHIDFLQLTMQKAPTQTTVFHITVEQGTVASLALPFLQLLAYCSHTNVAWVCTSALIIHLSCCPGGRHTIWAT